MAASLPKLSLPFNGDEPALALQLPNGTAFEGTKREYFDALMGLIHDTASKLAKLAPIEKECRTEVMKLLYPEGYPTAPETGRMDGTDRFELPGGWSLEYERRVSCKIDEVQLDSIRKAVSKLPIDPESGEIPSLGDAVRYRAELSDSKYGALAPEVRAILNQALEFKQGLPGVKLVAPKAKATTKASDQKAKGARS